MSTAKQKAAYAVFTFLSFALVGVGIVLPSWIAFETGGSKLVGLVLLVTSVLGVMLAPLAGYLTDCYDRKLMSGIGQIIRSLAMLLMAFAAEFGTGSAAPVLLVASGILGAFGFAILSGSLSGLLQQIVPLEQRTSFSLRISVAKQIGIASGTGTAGVAIHYLGSAEAAYFFAGASVPSIILLRALPKASRPARHPESFWVANLGAFVYLLARRDCLSAVVFTGLAYAIVQITNLLLPGFVANNLQADSAVFGALEMTAAVAGAISVFLVSAQRFAEYLRLRMVLIMVLAGISLLIFSFASTPGIAIVVYALAGVLWNVSRALASANFVIAIDNDMIGRSQGFSSLVTSCVGALIYLIPTIFPNVNEGSLYFGSGLAIVGCILALGLWARPRELRMDRT